MQRVPPPPKPRAGWRAWHARQSRIGQISFWLAAAVLLGLLGHVFGVARGLSTALIVLCGLSLLPLLLVLLYRWISRRVLWKVRNRLIVTYLLMGLAPIVLFGTLGSIALYLFAGQYSTNTALSLMDGSLEEVADETVSSAAVTLEQGTWQRAPIAALQAKSEGKGPTSIAILKAGLWQPLLPAKSSADATPFAGEAPPEWMHPPFRGLIARDRRLYLCSVATLKEESGPVVVLGSRPLNATSLGEIIQGMGKVTLFANTVGEGDEPEDIDVNGVEVRQELPAGGKHADSGGGFASVSGGTLAPRAYFFDTPVVFSSPLPIVSWETGKPISAMMWVVSRPAILYRHLFASSVQVGAVVRIVLLSIAVAFSLIELLAVLMAVGLSRTITRSVADLSRGTMEIDAGNLAHRVRVSNHDQLGDLARSFNGMASSISNLLEEQREKDRLLNELAIAQEVQANLFPKSPIAMSGLEMHAVCLPAQTVGGDYFDFILGPRNSLCLALGDISGKGISAALLMTSLHSAVRAFSLKGGDQTDDLCSPAVLLKDINQHLYHSTQSARYATLFVACYDAESRTLTYANGGHLPPVVLSSDGTIQRLEAGGPVVGLLDGMDYVEGKVQLNKGDLLIAFTDGLTEPEQGLVQFGEGRLIDAIRSNPKLPLPVMMGNTLSSLQRWIGNVEQPDDITLLLARQL